MLQHKSFIVSVESRKGGVGKTTAALNLAKIFIKHKYAVLFIDADITGTNVSDSLDSPFWKDITNVIKDNDKPANLLEWFDQKYMCGLDIPKYYEQLELGKIHIIGSQIYKSRNGTPNEKTRSHLVCSPSILFDELHSYWFIEFLKSICESFVKNNKQKCVIIIDNSPGYVGIAPAIHQWLTDLGPERGKFLTVSSLDKQDMIICCEAVNNLHQLFQNKIRATNLINNAIKNKGISLVPEVKAFFLRLVEEYNNYDQSHNTKITIRDSTKCYKESELEYYLSLISNENRKEEGNKSPTIYQNWIINRVPREIKNNIQKHNARLSQYFGSDYLELLNRLWGSDGEHGNFSAEQMVCYDEFIEWQFLHSIMKFPMSSINDYIYRNKSDRFHKIIFPLFDEIYSKIQSSKIDSLIGYKDYSFEQYEKISMSLEEMQKNIEIFINSIKSIGFTSFSRIIRPESYPLYPFNTLRDDFLGLMENSDYRIIKYENSEHSTGAKIDSFKMIHNYLLKYIDIPLPKEGKFLILKNSFISCISYIFNQSLWKSSFDGYDMQFITELLEIQYYRFSQREGDKRLRVQEFLATEELTEKSIHLMKVKFNNHCIGKYLGDNVGRNYFDFYKSLCYAQARLIDLKEDAEFILCIIKQFIMEGKVEDIYLPYVRSLCEKVIEKKTISHEEGMKRLGEGFAEANYMEEFSGVLTVVAKKWGMIN